MLLSLCYLVLRRVMQLAALRCRSNDFKELEIVVLRHELAILHRQSSRPGDDDRRPALLGGGEPAPSQGTLALVCDHAGDAASVASALGGEALDVRASSRSPSPERAGPQAAEPTEPARSTARRTRALQSSRQPAPFYASADCHFPVVIFRTTAEHQDLCTLRGHGSDGKQDAAMRGRGSVSGGTSDGRFVCRRPVSSSSGPAAAGPVDAAGCGSSSDRPLTPRQSRGSTARDRFCRCSRACLSGKTHDYRRHGTTTLFAGLRVLDGVVIGECYTRQRARSS